MTGKTITEVLVEGSAFLASKTVKNAAIETPSLDAAVLLCSVLSLEKAGLITRGKEPVAPEDYRAYKSLLNRRLEGVCVAYITGRREFYGLEFVVSEAVLVPRPETEILVETALETLKSISEKTKKPLRELKVLDLCTGSGAIAVTLKHEMPNLDVLGADISPEALAIARENSGRLCSRPVRFAEADIFGSIQEQFHLLTANPPYVPSGVIDTLSPEVRGEPRIALDGGSDGLDLLKRIITQAPDHLYAGGVLILEAGAEQMSNLRPLLEYSGFRDIRIDRDLSGQERIVSAMNFREAA